MGIGFIQIPKKYKYDLKCTGHVSLQKPSTRTKTCYFPFEWGEATWDKTVPRVGIADIFEHKPWCHYSDGWGDKGDRWINVDKCDVWYSIKSSEESVSASLAEPISTDAHSLLV